MRLLKRHGPRKAILLYHSIGDSPWALNKAMFLAQVEWLHSNSVIQPLENLLANHQTGGLEVAITFDDGYASLMEAAEILGKYNASATVYLNTAWIGEDSGRASDESLGHYPGERFLTWAQVETLRNAGWTIGSHGVEHLDLTTSPPDRVERELHESRLTVEDRLGISCEHFSYTWGRYDARLQAAVQEAGYATAVSGRHGPVSEDFDPFAIPRINVQCDYTPDDFIAILRGDWDYLGWWRRLRRG